MVFRGYSGMGYGAGATSKIIGQGAGSTISVSGSGSAVQGIAFDNLPGQGPADASVLVTNNQVMLRDLNISSPSIGISLQLPSLAEGEFWLQNILISGVAKVAGVVGNCGNAAIHFEHVLMYASDPQPPYGICISSAGAVIMHACDIDNAGTCLALVPGLGGAVNQHVDAVIISDSYFDNGNGFGNVLIQPQGNGFLSDVEFNNVWTSTVNNNKGTWNSNGFSIDGSMANGSLARPIQNVRLRGCWGRNFVNHCGVFARNVHALSIVDGSFTGNFDGINLQAGCTDFSLRGNYCGDYDIGPVGWPGGPALTGRNTRFGIVLQSPTAGMAMFNFLRGNGQGPLINYAPAIGQQIAFNLP